jgi:uncharacterized protein (DUF2147 family)
MKHCIWILLLISFYCEAQTDVTGKWKTIDEETNKETSIIEIFERDGKVFGRIEKIFPGPKDQLDPVCEECDKSDPRYRKKVIGMEILRNMKKSGTEYSGGDVLDPKNGKVYSCKIWRSREELKIRGYWGPFYRTQTWKKVH